MEAIALQYDPQIFSAEAKAVVERVADWMNFCMSDLHSKGLTDFETRVAEADLVSVFKTLGEELE